MRGKREELLLIVSFLLILVGSVAAADAAQISIQAREVEIDRLKGLVIARGGVRVTDGKVTITSQEMTLDQNRRRATFKGQVHVVRSSEELTAEVVTIVLDAKNTVQQVTASNGATVTTKEFLLSASEIHATLATETLRATESVRLLLPPDVLATAERLTFIRKTQEALLEGKPRVQSKDGYLTAERITIWLQAQKALASGSVKGEFAGTKFSAAEAKVDHKSKTAFLHGNVEIHRSSQQLHASVVTLYYGERRMVAEGEVRIRASGE
ncbi:MAG: LptA/OstA family protein [Armatimonadota bacterium]|nr:LptA/OstA family protein [Armatimonadota bacterium]